MWAKKLLGVTRKDEGDTLQDTSIVQEPEYSVASSGSRVLSGILQQHPNLSVFNTPSSPTKASGSGFGSLGRRTSLFKKSPSISSSSKRQSQQQLQILLAQAQQEQQQKEREQGQQQAEAEVEVDSFLSTSRVKEYDGPSETSLTTEPRTPAARKPSMGSMRSILRESNISGTAQKSVRFFSKDAYHIISPDSSTRPEQQTLPNANGTSTPTTDVRRQPTSGSKSSAKRSPPHMSIPKSLDLFNPPRASQDSSMAAASSTNLFDMSLDMAPIAAAQDGLQDDAIEVPDFDAVADELANPTPSPPRKDRSPSPQTSIEASAYLSMFDPPSSQLPPEQPAGSTSQIGETIFYSTNGIQTPSRELSAAAITPEQKSATAFLGPPSLPASTLLLANLSVSPDSSSQSIYSELISSQDELIASLQSQLTIQSEMSMQFEVDLQSRERLVEILTDQVESAEKETTAWRTDGERRKTTMRAWKKRFAQLEALCVKLESEVANGKQEKEERSIMDMASHEAMKALHHRVRTLESARTDLESKLKDSEIRLAREKDLVVSLKTQLAETSPGEQLQGRGHEESLAVAELRAKLKDVQISEHLARAAVEDLEDQIRILQANHGNLHAQVDLDATSKDRDEALAKLRAQREEMSMLKAEVEAQWRNTELMDEKVKTMAKDKKEALEKCAAVEMERDNLLQLRDNLKNEKRRFEDQSTTLETVVEELEAQKAEALDRVTSLEKEVRFLYESKKEIEHERNQLNDDVQQLASDLQEERETVERLADTASRLEERVSELESAKKFSEENTKRLQQVVQDRDTKLNDASTRIRHSEAETEQLRAQVSKIEKEHRRVVDEQRKTFDEAGGRTDDVQNLVREKAQTEVALDALREKAERRQEEAERLRRRIHELEQESASKEVKLTHAVKQRAQDLEDREGLNIALDSKQQELELLKRKMGVMGTAGCTPAPSRVRQDPPRRESSVFSTPATSRPPSSTSNRPLSETPATLRASNRANALATLTKPTTTVAKTPRLSETGVNAGRARTSPTPSTPGPLSIRTPATARRVSATLLPSVPTGPVNRRASLALSKSASSVPRRSSIISVAESEVADKENRHRTPTRIPVPS